MFVTYQRSRRQTHTCNNSFYKFYFSQNGALSEQGITHIKGFIRIWQIMGSRAKRSFTFTPSMCLCLHGIVFSTETELPHTFR